MIPPKVETTKLLYHRARPKGIEVDGALVHSMGEYVIDEQRRKVYAPDFLNSLTVSAHTFITPDGTILLGPGTDRVCFHAGKSRFEGRDGLNDSFLGCEFLVKGEHTFGSFLKAIALPDVYSEAQYNAGGWLYATWQKAFPAITNARIVAHSQVSGLDVRSDAKHDPGAGFQWPIFFAFLEQWKQAV